MIVRKIKRRVFVETFGCPRLQPFVVVHHLFFSAARDLSSRATHRFFKVSLSRGDGLHFLSFVVRPGQGKTIVFGLVLVFFFSSAQIVVVACFLLEIAGLFVVVVVVFVVRSYSVCATLAAPLFVPPFVQIVFFRVEKFREGLVVLSTQRGCSGRFFPAP